MPKKKKVHAKKKPAKKYVNKTATEVVKQSPAKKAVKKMATKAAKKAAKNVKKKEVPKTVTKAGKKSDKKTAPDSPAKKSLKKKLVKKSPPRKTSSAKAKTPGTTKVSGADRKRSSDESKPIPIVFSLDDVEELIASNKSENKNKNKKEAPKKKAAPQPKKVVVEDEPAEQRVWGAASLADILGFNPAEKKKNTDLRSEELPKKWKKYYKLLVELRAHVRDELNLHTSDTLKHSSRDDSGDLSGYGNHQADVGTETFDRDFALSLVSSEQEALNEIEEAILRIKNGSYGVCEVTGKPIPAARLTAVPFARFSVEGQAEYEKNLRRKVDRSGNTGLFGDAADAPKLPANDDEE